MRTLGLLGGMSWESTGLYYRLINQGVKAQLGGLHSAEIILYSVDFQIIEEWQRAGKWKETGGYLGDAAMSLERAGADGLVICTNTMHKVASQIEERISMPLLHIADATAEALVAQGVERVGLLGTTFTMEQDFYRGRLEFLFGLDVLVPQAPDRQKVHDVIYQELCLGETREDSRRAYVDIIEKMRRDGAQGVILGCTEIGLLVSQDDTDVPLFDTTALHAKKAVDFALGEWNENR